MNREHYKKELLRRLDLICGSLLMARHWIKQGAKEYADESIRDALRVVDVLKGETNALEIPRAIEVSDVSPSMLRSLYETFEKMHKGNHDAPIVVPEIKIGSQNCKNCGQRVEYPLSFDYGNKHFPCPSCGAVIEKGE